MQNIEARIKSSVQERRFDRMLNFQLLFRCSSALLAVDFLWGTPPQDVCWHRTEGRTPTRTKRPRATSQPELSLTGGECQAKPPRSPLGMSFRKKQLFATKLYFGKSAGANDAGE